MCWIILSKILPEHNKNAFQGIHLSLFPWVSTLFMPFFLPSSFLPSFFPFFLPSFLLSFLPSSFFPPFFPFFLQQMFIEPAINLVLGDTDPFPATTGAWDRANIMFSWSHPSYHQPSPSVPSKSATARTQPLSQVPCPLTIGHPSPPCWQAYESMGWGYSLVPGLMGGKLPPSKVQNKEHPWESKLMFPEKNLEKHSATMTTSSIPFP